MFWWLWGGGWVAGLFMAAFWVAVIVVAVLLLRREIPQLRLRYPDSPALRLLEERYARGEIDRNDFLHRREILLLARSPVGPEPSPPGPSGSEGGGAATASPPDIPDRPEETPRPHGLPPGWQETAPPQIAPPSSAPGPPAEPPTQLLPPDSPAGGS